MVKGNPTSEAAAQRMQAINAAKNVTLQQKLEEKGQFEGLALSLPESVLKLTEQQIQEMISGHPEAVQLSENDKVLLSAYTKYRVENALPALPFEMMDGIQAIW